MYQQLIKDDAVVKAKKDKLETELDTTINMGDFLMGFKHINTLQELQ